MCQLESHFVGHGTFSKSGSANLATGKTHLLDGQAHWAVAFEEVLGLIPEDATNPFCLCRGPLLFPCQHCVIVWLEVRILPISKWQVLDNFSLLSLLCPDVAKFRWEPIRASLAC